MLRGLVVAPLLLLALVLAGPAAAGGPATLVGVAEDSIKQPTLVGARAELDLVRLAGFDTVRVTAIWAPGETAPSATELARLRNAAGAARLAGVRVIVAVYHFGSRTTPLTDEARGEFARFAASIARAIPYLREFIIGNEPNINRFWLPQFETDGSNAASPAYLKLLAESYDALKAVTPRVTVTGGAVSPRGGDNPALSRHTHSPTKFIRDLGAAYRASGRTTPVMDQFAIHPHTDSPGQAPRDSAHPRSTTISIADYDKLVALLGEAFDGTAQRGSTLPIVYAEFGIESLIPPAKERLYTGSEPATIRPVDEETQGAYYRQAVELAFCQPNVRGIMLFLVQDEPTRATWQSGLFYVDRTPKASLRHVQRAAAESRGGTVARCEGMQLPVKAAKLAWPRGSGLAARPLRVRLTCSLTCTYEAKLERVADGRAVATARGRLAAKAAGRLALGGKSVPAGRYRVRLSLVAPVNPAPPTTVVSPLLALR